jgi:hypothetical protein
MKPDEKTSTAYLMHQTTVLFQQYQELVEIQADEIVELKLEVAQLKSLLSDEIKSLAVAAKGIKPIPEVRLMPKLSVGNFGTGTCRKCRKPFLKTKRQGKLCVECYASGRDLQARRMHAARAAKRNVAVAPFSS